MSFLSSHRLHWGVHHELSDNFWVHLEHMVREASGSSPATSADLTAPGTVNVPELPGEVSSPVDPQPEALGP